MYINTDFRKETHADGELRNSQFTLHSQAREVERVPVQYRYRAHRHGSATDSFHPPPALLKAKGVLVLYPVHVEYGFGPSVPPGVSSCIYVNAPSLLDALRGGREWRGAAKAPRTISGADRRESLLRCFFISRVRFGRIRLLRSSAHRSHRLAIIQALEQARRRQSEFFAAQHHLRQRNRCCNRRA
jgi:hypothetical protein